MMAQPETALWIGLSILALSLPLIAWALRDRPVDWTPYVGMAGLFTILGILQYLSAT
jgi:hypothetical protein